jgi:small conductance mechanosensitive channel
VPGKLEPQESYSLPQLTDTLTHLNKFGAVIIGSLYFVLIAVVLIYFLNKFVVKVLLPRLSNKRYALVAIFTLYALVLVTASLLVLNRMGFDITLIARISFLIVIVASALIAVIAPYLPELPFKLGDLVELGGIRGNIVSITPVFTRMQTLNGKTVFIPTATVWTKNIVNYHFTPTRRVELSLVVSADHSLDDARAVLLDIMGSEPRVQDEPAPKVRVNAASAEGVDVVGMCWVKNDDFLDTRGDLYQKVVEATQSSSGLSLALERQQVVLSGEVVNR